MWRNLSGIVSLSACVCWISLGVYSARWIPETFERGVMTGLGTPIPARERKRRVGVGWISAKFGFFFRYFCCIHFNPAFWLVSYISTFSTSSDIVLTVRDY